MRLKVFTKEFDENKRATLEFAQEIEKYYDVEYVNLDSKDAGSDAEIYDVYSTPTLLVVRDDGTEIKGWRGQLPILSEVKLALNR